MKIWLRINGLQPCSWTIVWHSLRKAFEAIGCTIYASYTYDGSPSSPTDFVEVWWGDPRFWQWSGKGVMLRVGIVLTEAHSILYEGRDSTINNLKACDLIICPSFAATIGIREAPIDVPAVVIPFGVDCDEFHHVERDWTGTLKFLHLGAVQFRKGSWMVPEAFLRAFAHKDDVSVTIASYVRTGMFLRMKREYERHPQMNFVENFLKTPFELYQDHHVLLSPHLSEGFGLVPLEAMATGMACIVSRCSAPREYFDRRFGWWIEMSEDYVPVSDCLPRTNGFWRLPSLDSLAEAMLDVYNKRSDANERGARASEYVLENYSWKRSVESIATTIAKFLSGGVFDENAFRCDASLQ